MASRPQEYGTLKETKSDASGGEVSHLESV